VNRVIKHRVNQLAREKELAVDFRDHLQRRLLEIPHRTYLWVYLVFDYLQTQGFGKTNKRIESAINTLPKGVNEAYEKILSKSEESLMVRKALCIILAAYRPLTLREMNVAVNIEHTSKSMEDVDPELDKDFNETLRNLCGLFIQIYDKKVYFLHQTAREFLLQKDLSQRHDLVPGWNGSVSIQEAHSVLAMSCIIYIDLIMSADEKSFLEYSAGHWVTHFRDADMKHENLELSILSICNPETERFLSWFEIYWYTVRFTIRPMNMSALSMAACFGIEGVKQLLRSGLFNGQHESNLESKDSHGQTPLSLAAENGHEAVVKLLVDELAKLESKVRFGPILPLVIF
jgi:hypothetical protein